MEEPIEKKFTKEEFKLKIEYLKSKKIDILDKYEFIEKLIDPILKTLYEFDVETKIRKILLQFSPNTEFTLSYDLRKAKLQELLSEFRMLLKSKNVSYYESMIQESEYDLTEFDDTQKARYKMITIERKIAEVESFLSIEGISSLVTFLYSDDFIWFFYIPGNAIEILRGSKQMSISVKEYDELSQSIKTLEEEKETIANEKIAKDFEDMAVEAKKNYDTYFEDYKEMSRKFLYWFILGKIILFTALSYNNPIFYTLCFLLFFLSCFAIELFQKKNRGFWFWVLTVVAIALSLILIYPVLSVILDTIKNLKLPPITYNVNLINESYIAQMKTTLVSFLFISPIVLAGIIYIRIFVNKANKEYKTYITFTHVAKTIKMFITYEGKEFVSNASKEEFFRGVMEVITKNPYDVLMNKKEEKGKGLDVKSIKEISEIISNLSNLKKN